MALLFRSCNRPYLFLITFIIGIILVLRFDLLFQPIVPNPYQNDSLIIENNSTNSKLAQVRISKDKRRFVSTAVESLIDEIKRNIKNKELAWLFENCFPNTLDTTVDFNANETATKPPDTYVISGDVNVMWLRDSSAQIHPYLPLMKNDLKLRKLIEGVILRQLICIQRDPYASAYYKNFDRISEWKYLVNTEMRDGIHERKWGLDSLCYVLRLMYSYWQEVNHDLTFFLKYEAEFKITIRIILDTLKVQRRYSRLGPYIYQREGNPPDPRGAQAKPNGLLYTFFRPSDDLQTYPYLIPSQFFAYHTLKLLFELVHNFNWTHDFDSDIFSINSDLYKILFDEQIKDNLETLITKKHEKYGLIYVYEINGMGSKNIMDGTHAPSLLSLPYLCSNIIPINDSIYQNTRKFIFSTDNTWYYKGSVLEGISGKNMGSEMVSTLAIIMRGLTAIDDDEIRLCLRMLEKAHGYTGFMHESVNIDDPTQFTRSWYAWANSLFGEFIWKLYREKRYLLNEIPTEDV
ncbi:unnamed protein product [Adineta steineri]|uniref:Uncharacterized protein n=1 Tax=Adineta steineri TaxID=433720 RepID=A0A814EL48_9BILA|nr:unnamed protein product [Adineta steineri]